MMKSIRQSLSDTEELKNPTTERNFILDNGFKFFKFKNFFALFFF